MSAQMKSINLDVSQTCQGPWVIRETFAATGLTPNGAETVPFPQALQGVPLRVFLTAVGNGAAGALVSLDTSQGAADPTNSFAGGKLGFDQNNLYVYIGNASEFQVTVEYNGQ
jgi:hypothetical protein